MKGQIYVLKRSNGMCGIYVNGHRQQDLKGNFSLKDNSKFMFDRIMYEYNYQAHNNGIICDIVFTEDEDNFKSDLPSIEQCLKG
jgi:hypothetical protein